MRALALGLSMLTLCLVACGAPKPPTQVAAVDVRGVLVPTEKLSPPFVVQQRIHGKYQGGAATMDCVVQLSDGKLTVLGLTPFGTRAFVIEQKGVDVHFEKFVDRDLPVQPDAVLYDIHRVFFRGLPKPDSDGVREAQDQSEMVRETWAGGHLTERRFQNLEGPYANLIVVTFDGPPAPVVAPHVRITNVAHGYTLDLENSDQKLLEGASVLQVESKPVPAPLPTQPLPSVPPPAK
ncbi:MAG: hypothetical protein JWN04_2932 [Myxococcaceae bacterium]|nr:hypothetical protein [Myxococcaceae bacterium]